MNRRYFYLIAGSTTAITSFFLLALAFDEGKWPFGIIYAVLFVIGLAITCTGADE